MTYLVVSSDFLASPAFCDADSIDDCVTGLIAIRRCIEEADQKIFLEHGALEGMERNGVYPLTELVRENSEKRNFISEYSANDISRVVNKILSACVDENVSLPQYIGEWEDREIHPMLIGLVGGRSIELECLIEQVSLFARHNRAIVSILHHPVEKERSAVCVRGVLKEIYPDICVDLPCQFSVTTPVTSFYSDFVSSLDGARLYDAAIQDDEKFESKIIEAIRVEVESLRRLKGVNGPSFTIGAGFLATLSEFQCGPGERFGRTTFSTICEIIADARSALARPFYENYNKKVQLEREGKFAWRAHITTGNPALRLMFWSTDTGIELANVGNKKDLLII
ncbi:hypothetical protein RZV17_02915 [Xanthomonas cannabis]|uniref:hypothetical protein n=1 Tax=Xanthomonas cannabis TaxID=1885674 RepID=UPI0033B18B0C